MITVQELIDALSRLPRDAKVIREAPEGGYYAHNGVGESLLAVKVDRKDGDENGYWPWGTGDIEGKDSEWLTGFHDEMTQTGEAFVAVVL